MKLLNSLIALGLVFAGTSQAQMISMNHYRIYEGALHIGNTSIPLSMKVNDEVLEHRRGDPEIPGHGVMIKYLNVDMSEGDIKCEHEVVAKADLDSDSEMLTCSGLRLSLASLNDLLQKKDVGGVLRLQSSKTVVGSIELKLTATQDGDHDGGLDD